METPSLTIREISSHAARSSNIFRAAAPPFFAANGHAANGLPRLTLSAHRRPEEAVRLTDASPTLSIYSEYDLLDPSRCPTLGHGTSSTVRLAHRRIDGRPVAVKTIAKHDALGLWSRTGRWRAGARASRRSPRLDEVDVLTSLGSACADVVQLLDVYETHHEVHLVLEYCGGGDLFDCIKRRRQLEEGTGCGPEASMMGNFSELETASVARAMLKILDTLHLRNIVHRDIKPENILLVNEDDCMGRLGKVKLTDFGLAILLQDDAEASSGASVNSDENSARKRGRAYSCVGSDYYAAPEIRTGLGYDTPVDVYSLGVTLYVMLCGTPPSSTSVFKLEDAYFSNEDSSRVAPVSEESSRPSQCSRSELFPSELKVSPSAQDLISKMIHPDPQKRIVASEALKHEWFAKHFVHRDAAEITHVTSRPSLISSSKSIRSRTPSLAKTESLLRIGPMPPAIPPTNSPRLEIAQAPHVGIAPGVCGAPTPLDPKPSLAVSLTLVDVCNKLAPLADEQQLHKQRKQRRCSRAYGDRVCIKSSSKHSRNSGGDEQQWKKKRLSTAKKKSIPRGMFNRAVYHPSHQVWPIE